MPLGEEGAALEAITLMLGNLLFGCCGLMEALVLLKLQHTGETRYHCEVHMQATTQSQA